jgi:hypothetical protein
MDKYPIAVPHTSRCQSPRRRLNTDVEFSPCPGGVAPDQRGTIGESARRLDQQMRQIRSRN